MIYFRKIEDLRVDNDLTQQNIADYLGCMREVYRRYEKGTRTIPIDFIIKLADLYGVSIDYLLEHAPKKDASAQLLQKLRNDAGKQKNNNRLHNTE